LLEGLEISEVRLNNLEFSSRIDAEYYRPAFLHYENILKLNNGIRLDNFSNFLIGPFGSSFTVDNYTDDKAYRYIRGKDVKPLKLMDDDNVYMPKSDYQRLVKYALKENDILVSVVGTIGNAAIITKKDLPSIFSCKSTVLRTKSINSAYLLVYLNTKYGRDLLIRKERGAIQKGLNLDDLKSLIIYNPSELFQNQIEICFLNSLKKTEYSKQFYQQAETLLLEAIGLQNFKPSKENVNPKQFKDSFLLTGRLDAEYFQKKYEQIVEQITSQKHSKLKEIVNIKKSIEPGSAFYSDEGLPFYRVSDYNKFGLSEPDKKLTSEFCNSNAELIDELKPVKGTILFSKDGSVGTAYLLRNNLHGITSGAILHLTIKDENQILPEYITLVLNSKLVQMQAERDAGGSIILHWRTGEIENVVVPVISMDKQRQISDLVEESFRLKKQSENLLEFAKQAVELAIEEGEDKGMEYIEDQMKLK
jgi:restriction endonuclease S subunit